MSRRVEIAVAGRTVGLSSPDKQLVEGVTKRAFVDHWLAAGPLTVAAVGSRLVSARRAPDGPGGEAFFQKNAPVGMPPWTRIVRVPSDSSDTGHTDHVVLADVPHLVALAQFGTVEVHVGTWSIDDPWRPRELLLDLDPPPDAPTSAVRDALRRTVAVVDEVGLPRAVKTTGSKGFHVHVPVTGADQDLARDVASLLARTLATRHPDTLTTAFHRADRRGRVLVDQWRNSGGATAVAPWSPRIAPGGPVARPLTRAEVDEHLDDVEPDDLRVADVAALLAAHGDPWADRPAPADVDTLHDVVDRLREGHRPAT